MAREVVRLRGSSLDDNSLYLQSAMLYLGRALARLDSVPAGVAMMREAQRLRRRGLPADHWLQASTDASLGEVLTLGGQYAEAESLLLDAEKRLLAGRGEQHEATQTARTRLVALYQRWGKPAQAATWQTKVTVAPQ